MNVHTMKIASEFSRHPAGRFTSDGPFAGEIYRIKHLIPALKKNECLVIELDGTAGYGSSFLEEAFGGLVRVEKFSPSELRKRIQFRSRDATLIDEIWGYIDDAGSPDEIQKN